MHQAITTFHIAKGDGTETLVRAGKVFPDGHPFVKADVTGVLFEKLADEDFAKDDTKGKAAK